MLISLDMNLYLILIQTKDAPPQRNCLETVSNKSVGVNVFSDNDFASLTPISMLVHTPAEKYFVRPIGP